MLRGPHIHLRALEPSDIDLLYKWENDSELWYVSNTLTPFSRFTLEQYVINAHQDIYTARQLRMMIIHSQDEIALGTIDLFDFEPTHRRAGLGIMIIHEYRRSGYAEEAIKLMTSYCFETLLLHQLYCNIAMDNLASLGLFEKAGFTICGTKKQWLLDRKGWKDEHLLQLLNPLI